MIGHAAILLVLLGLTAAAGAQTLPKLKGQGYAQARSALLKHGWKPVALPGADRCEPGDGRCTGRPEMYVCAGSGRGQCVFVWRRGGLTIDIFTEGEGAPVVMAVRARKGL